MRTVLAGLVILVLAACAEPSDQLGTQTWQGATVEVQTRPSPVRIGMNEVLVIVTDQQGIPVSDLIVSVRAEETDSWTQLIQDGLTGVYRRAVRVDAKTQALSVQLRRDEQASVLRFPIPGGKASV